MNFFGTLQTKGWASYGLSRLTLSTFLLLFLLFSNSTTKSQIVINEILPDGTVELKNVGTASVDVSSYWLCDFPSYTEFSDLNVTFGNLNIGAGELLVIDDFNFIDANDGELGLYTSASFSSPAALIDYVEWGSTGHQRSSVAVSAGIWTTGDFVPAFGAGESLAFDGEGDASSDWSAGTPTIGAENGITPPCDVFVNDITLEDGTTSTSICVDGNADPLVVVTNGGTPNVSTGWIITDDIGNILALPAGGPFDLDGAGIGTCQIWYIRYEMGTGFGGNEVGNNLTDLTGCFALSNPIEVIREAADGGTVSLADGTNAATIIVDGVADPLEVVHVTTAPNLTYRYVITDSDADNTILAITDSNVIDLDGAGAGVCRIWGWSYRGLDQADFIGLPLADLQAEDCSDISSDFIEVTRVEDDCEVFVNDITLEDGTTSTSICVDGNADPLVVVTNGGTPNVSTGWIITDDIGNILALPAGGPFDLDGAGIGTCQIWYIRYEMGTGFGGNDVGNNLTDLTGCFALSNPIEVIREAADGGTVSLADGTNAATIIVDGVADPLEVVHVTTAPNLTYRYVITDSDADNTILAITDSNVIDLDGAGAGVCRIWGWSYRGLDQADFIGLPLADLQAEDCSDISSDFIEVTRVEDDCDVFVNDITLEDGTTSTSICVDGNADPLVVVTNGGTPNVSTGWIITDDIGNILALPAGGPFDLDGAGIGTCQIWYIRYEMGTGFGGNDVGNNLTDLTGCFALSNPIEVIREAADGGTVSLADGTNAATIIVDGVADPLEVVHVTTAPNLTYRYVITDSDADNTILAISNSNVIDLDGAGVGVCRIWGWSYRGLDQNDFIGLPLADLQAEDCSDISSDFIEVTREEDNGNTGADLSLTVINDNLLYNQYETTTFRITVENEGTETVNNIFVNSPLPNGLVFTSVTQTQGEFNLFTQQWEVGELAVGESAYLDLTLFSLVDGQDLTFFAEVATANPTDVDSTPGNGANNEDDNDSITIQPASGGGPGSPNGDVDLELTITTDVSEYTIYEPITYTITLVNNGSEDATNAVVSAGLPSGLVFTSATTNAGDYNLFFEQWTVDFLAVGDEAELNLTLFPLVTGVDVTNFVEVFTTQQADPDSTPGNGDGVTPNEDDEAAITLFSTSTTQPFANINTLQFAGGKMAVNNLYPNPAVNVINVNLVSMKDADATVTIVNRNGQVVQTLSQEISMGINELYFNISDLPSGNYYINIDGVEGNRQARQFVKVN